MHQVPYYIWVCKKDYYILQSVISYKLHYYRFYVKMSQLFLTHLVLQRWYCSVLLLTVFFSVFINGFCVFKSCWPTSSCLEVYFAVLNWISCTSFVLPTSMSTKCLFSVATLVATTITVRCQPSPTLWSMSQYM